MMLRKYILTRSELQSYSLPFVKNLVGESGLVRRFLSPHPSIGVGQCTVAVRLSCLFSWIHERTQLTCRFVPELIKRNSRHSCLFTSRITSNSFSVCQEDSNHYRRPLARPKLNCEGTIFI